MLVMSTYGRADVVTDRRLAAYVYDALKERLLQGEWRAGDHLVVEALKSEFGTSKQPVMEALRRLAGDNLVEIIPQVGCRVPTFPSSEVSNFFVLFAGLESESAAIAAAHAGNADIVRLAGINAQIGALSAAMARQDRVRNYLALNRQFHTAILDMARSAMVSRTSSRMWDMCDLIIGTSGNADPLADEIGERHADHEMIIAALREADIAEVREQMRRHVLRNVPMLERSRAAAQDS
jgi:DNA-binding GntR family transcriptional regulator